MDHDSTLIALEDVREPAIGEFIAEITEIEALLI